jgi:hypothetical protein
MHVYIHMFMYKCIKKTNGERQLPFFAANGKRKRQTSFCFLLTETENGSCRPWLANNKW